MIRHLTIHCTSHHLKGECSSTAATIIKFTRPSLNINATMPGAHATSSIV